MVRTGCFPAWSVTLGSFTHGALVDLNAEDLGRMLELDETLFVEHKTDIGKDTAYGLVSAVASFANTVGGWFLVGVNGRAPERERGTLGRRGKQPDSGRCGSRPATRGARSAPRL